MYIVIFSSFICLFLTYLDSVRKFKNGLSFSFILLTFLAAIHYDYGNDYMGYYDLYNHFTHYSFDFHEIVDGDYKDYGWVFLCYLFKPFGGFFTMVAVLSVIQNIIVYRFIRREVNRTWWPMSVFIYLFVTNYYLWNFSMLRQGLVVCVFLGLWSYIRDRKWWIPLIVLSLCSTIHGTSVILIPFAFWGFIPVQKNRIIAIIYIVLFILLFLSKDFLSSTLETVLQFETLAEYADTYGDSQETVSFGLGYMLGLLPFAIAEYYLLRTTDNPNNRRIVMLSILSFIIVPFSAIIPLISRIAVYFGIFQLASLPLIYNSIKKREVRLILLLPFVLLTLYSYRAFFKGGVYAESYRYFHTIFTAL